MEAIEKTYRQIVYEKGDSGFISAPSMLVVTLLFIIAVLSVPVQEPQKIIWFAVYPIIASEITSIGFGKVFIKSLWIIPFIALIGMFNPIIDTRTAFRVGNVGVSCGWVSFTSIILRGLLSFQAVLILVMTTGFLDMFNSMRRLGCPAVLTTQLFLTYRYIAVIMEEALTMKRARTARGYGKKKYPLVLWGRLVGQLLVRSMQRATRIHKAMCARGFNGTMPTGNSLSWNGRAFLWLAVWITVIIALRFIDFSDFITNYAI